MLSEDRELADRIRHVLNSELIRRLLIKYFTEKGFSNFNSPIYPPILQDMSVRIPELTNKVEMIPHVREINPATGQVTIGWNLFVLGTNRIDLGESTHNNLAELQRAIYGQQYGSTSLNDKSPADVIDFITKVLSHSQSGIITPQIVTPISHLSVSDVVNRPRIGSTLSGQYYEKRKPL